MAILNIDHNSFYLHSGETESKATSVTVTKVHFLDGVIIWKQTLWMNHKSLKFKLYMKRKERNKTKEPTEQAKPFQWKYHLKWLISFWFSSKHLDCKCLELETSSSTNWRVLFLKQKPDNKINNQHNLGRKGISCKCPLVWRCLLPNVDECWGDFQPSFSVTFQSIKLVFLKEYLSASCTQIFINPWWTFFYIFSSFLYYYGADPK